MTGTPSRSVVCTLCSHRTLRPVLLPALPTSHGPAVLRQHACSACTWRLYLRHARECHRCDGSTRPDVRCDTAQRYQRALRDARAAGDTPYRSVPCRLARHQECASRRPCARTYPPGVSVLPCACPCHRQGALPG